MVEPRLLHRVEVLADGRGQTLDRRDLVGAVMSDTGTEQGLNALPLMWHVQALQTSRPQPYFGPWIPSRSRSTHRRRRSSGQSTRHLLAVEDEGVVGHQKASLRPSVGDCGIGGTVGRGVNPSGELWLIGKLVGSVPVARA